MERETFRAERRRLKVTQEELAEDLGILVETVRGVEAGAAEVDDSWLASVRGIAARRLEPVANGVGADG